MATGFEKELAEVYYSMASTEMALNYYELFERWYGEYSEEEEKPTDIAELRDADKIVHELGNILCDVLLNGEFTEANLNKAYKLKTDVEKNVSDVLVDADRYRLLEYVVNRVEPYFTEPELSDPDTEDSVRNILDGVFAQNDNAVINENIKFIVSQLPLRMTKNRFFDIIDNSLRKYNQGSKDVFDKEIYMIETAAGLKASENGTPSMVTAEDFAAFKRDSLKNMTAEEFLSVENKMIASITIARDTLEIYSQLAEILNRLIVVMLNGDCRADVSIVQNTAVLDIIRITSNNFNGGEGNTAQADQTLTNAFVGLEGTLEKFAERMVMLESKLMSRIESMKGEVSPELIRLDRSQKLMSNSMFIDLTSASEEELTEEYIDSEINRLVNSFNAAFSGDDRMMSRARMAAALKELPVYFESRTEVMNYVKDSLSACSDLGEKHASIQLILSEFVGE